MHVAGAVYVTPAIELPREVVPPHPFFSLPQKTKHLISFVVILCNFSDFFQKWNTIVEINTTIVITLIPILSDYYNSHSNNYC